MSTAAAFIPISKFSSGNKTSKLSSGKGPANSPPCRGPPPPHHRPRHKGSDSPLACAPRGAAELCAEPCRLAGPRLSPRPGVPRGDLEVTLAGSAVAPGALGCSRHSSRLVASRGLPAGPVLRGRILPARGKRGNAAPTAAPRPTGPLGGEEDAGGWICCSRGCSSQAEIMKAGGGGDALNHFAAFRRTPLE